MGFTFKLKVDVTDIFYFPAASLHALQTQLSLLARGGYSSVIMSKWKMVQMLLTSIPKAYEEDFKSFCQAFWDFHLHSTSKLLFKNPVWELDLRNILFGKKDLTKPLASNRLREAYWQILPSQFFIAHVSTHPYKNHKKIGTDPFRTSGPLFEIVNLLGRASLNPKYLRSKKIEKIYLVDLAIIFRQNCSESLRFYRYKCE